MKDKFHDVLSSINSFPAKANVEMAPSFPSVGQDESIANSQKYEYKVKYGRFAVDEEGNTELEEIMESCLLGKKILCWERVTETRDGDTLVTVKYIEPTETQSPIEGQRRQRKARHFNEAET
jgi:hypothetical protein